MSLIDGEAFRKKFFELEIEFRPSQIDAIFDCLENSELVDAEPVKHGEWVDDGYYANYTNMKAFHCSECSWHMIGYEDELFRYCPTCGAKMEMKEK